MKPHTFLHPSPDTTIRQGYRVVHLPRSAPPWLRAWRWFINLVEEWRATVTPRTAEHIYRSAVILAVVVFVVSVLGGLHWAIDLTGNSTYYIHKSSRTGQIVRVLDPKGRVVAMPLEEVEKLRHKRYDLVP